MKLLFVIAIIGAAILGHCKGQSISAKPERRLVCYYDAQSSLRAGFAQLNLQFLDLAAQLCTHLMYGYAGLKRETYEVSSINVDLDMFHFKEVTALKTKYPHLKIFLSVGGDHDHDDIDPLKYIHLLEAGKALQLNFIHSSINLLKMNGFDGLDLAFQFPTNKPRKVHSTLGIWWKKFKKLFTGDFIVDPQADLHKQQYSEFVKDLAEQYHNANLNLSMTVLPNVNSTWYFDIKNIQSYFEFINLMAFDFLTPERNPEEADYAAPIYFKEEDDRLPHLNIHYQVNYWSNNGCPSTKLNLGVATYGRAWKLSTKSGLSGMPVVLDALGPAEPGLQSNISGLLSWPEICSQLSEKKDDDFRGANAPLRKVSDLEHYYGNYAYRPADENDQYGVWISFDDPDFVAVKANYAKSKNMGGVAVYDLAYDDFRGFCSGIKYPILQSIKLLL